MFVQSRTIRELIALAIIVCGTVVVQADDMAYVTLDHSGLSGQYEFGSLDLETGTMTIIGRTTVSIGGLAVDSTGNLYTSNYNSKPGQLYTINPNPGSFAVTATPNTGFTTTGSHYFNDIGSADGNIYSLVYRNDDLYTVSTSGSAIADVTPSSTQPDYTNISNPQLAMSTGGSELYISFENQLWSFDPTSDKYTEITANLGIPDPGNVRTAGFLASLVYEDNTLYGLGWMPTTNEYRQVMGIYTIDPNTGQILKEQAIAQWSGDNYYTTPAQADNYQYTITGAAPDIIVPTPAAALGGGVLLGLVGLGSMRKKHGKER